MTILPLSSPRRSPFQAEPAPDEPKAIAPEPVKQPRTYPHLAKARAIRAANIAAAGGPKARKPNTPTPAQRALADAKAKRKRAAARAEVLTPPTDEPSAPGALSPTIPTLPADLASALTPRDYRAVLELVRGGTWRDACDAAGFDLRDPARIADGPKPAIRNASVWLVERIAERATTSREWIRRSLYTVYKRAMQEEEVRDRKGAGTGVFRYDGSTALRALELMGKDIGMFGSSDRGIAPSDVAQLLAAVASRGRPALPGDRARVVNQAPDAAQPTAPQQPEK